MVRRIDRISRARFLARGVQRHPRQCKMRHGNSRWGGGKNKEVRREIYFFLLKAHLQPSLITNFPGGDTMTLDPPNMGGGDRREKVRGKESGKLRHGCRGGMDAPVPGRMS